MATHTLKLPQSFVNLLVSLPETGMGYQLVNVFLHGGKVLRRKKVLNASLLVLDDRETIREQDIEKIEPGVK